ncbi:MAG: LIM domain-containing protein [Piptocephalis tieghemiana]|nr:MAG: LIM domain-containing protein [Piptocephalis tieghemiana]
MFGPKCRGCRRRIRRDCVHALGHRWHPECFVCEDCNRPFGQGVFFELDKHAYCERHYHQRRGTLCPDCGDPVVGECVSALEHKFHPQHFVCCLCRKSLLECAFGDKDGLPCCGDCL